MVKMEEKIIDAILEVIDKIRLSKDSEMILDYINGVCTVENHGDHYHIIWV